MRLPEMHTLTKPFSNAVLAYCRYTAVDGDDVMITEKCLTSSASAAWRHVGATVAAAAALAVALLALL